MSDQEILDELAKNLKKLPVTYGVTIPKKGQYIDTKWKTVRIIAWHVYLAGEGNRYFLTLFEGTSKYKEKLIESLSKRFGSLPKMIDKDDPLGLDFWHVYWQSEYQNDPSINNVYKATEKSVQEIDRKDTLCPTTPENPFFSRLKRMVSKN